MPSKRLKRSKRSKRRRVLRGFFGQGWCLGSSGACGARLGCDAWLVTPSGVPKELLEPEDARGVAIQARDLVLGSKGDMLVLAPVRWQPQVLKGCMPGF